MFRVVPRRDRSPVLRNHPATSSSTSSTCLSVGSRSRPPRQLRLAFGSGTAAGPTLLLPTPSSAFLLLPHERLGDTPCGNAQSDWYLRGESVTRSGTLAFTWNCRKNDPRRSCPCSYSLRDRLDVIVSSWCERVLDIMNDALVMRNLKKIKLTKNVLFFVSNLPGSKSDQSFFWPLFKIVFKLIRNFSNLNEFNIKTHGSCPL